METRGAGIVVQGGPIGLLRTHGADALPTTHCTVRRYLRDGGDGEEQRAPQDFTSWGGDLSHARRGLPYRSLPLVRYAHRFRRQRGHVQAHIDGHGLVEAQPPNWLTALEA
jgi:hypothetical protein